jgi:ornithine racemase
MSSPRVAVDLDKIRCNARHLVQRLGLRGIEVTGVTKAVCGDPEIAGALLDGGVSGLADARIENVERMRQAGIKAPIALLRPPTPGQANRVVQNCSASYNTEFDTIDALARAARRINTVHDVILMVEMGDMREGILPDNLVAAARAVIKMPGVALKGIGANFACLGGIAPGPEKMAELAALADEIESVCGQSLETVSGGNSTSLPWVFGAESIGRVNDLRLGEAILLGVDPLSGRQIDGLVTDAFTLVAEVIESKIKPGSICGPPKHPDGLESDVVPGLRQGWQAILAIGNQDTDLAGLTLPPGLASLGGTSDQLVVETSGRDLAVGTEIDLQPNYSALMRVMNAPGVAKVMRNRRPQNAAGSAGRYRPDLALV